MTRLRALAPMLLAALLIVPALALATVKRGVYIDNAKQVTLETNAAATSVKSLSVACSEGGFVIKKALKISATGAFSYSGKTTVRGVKNTVISVKLTGKIAAKATGKVSYPDANENVGCAVTSFSAKYYGVNPQG